MKAAARWAVAVAASVLVFFVIAVPWALAVPGGDDPWDLIAPVAGVVAAGLLAALGWWAAQGGGSVHQTARSTGPGAITQTGGSQGGTSNGRPPANVRQEAEGPGDIDQVGGNRA